jgi:uracil-DNA glycosylase
MAVASLAPLLEQVRACTHCADHLPLAPKPILQAHEAARVLIVGRAPGLRTHEHGLPFEDASGKRLQEWLGVTREEFFDAQRFAILPVGFCYPGKGGSGDAPPRPECAPLWHDVLLGGMPEIRLTLLLGEHAQRVYLGVGYRGGVTETVRAWREYLPLSLPLPHPSPRNNAWMAANPWFAQETLPALRAAVAEALA